MSFGSVGSKGGVLGKRPGGMISMKLKPQVHVLTCKFLSSASAPAHTCLSVCIKLPSSDSILWELAVQGKVFLELK